MQDQKIILKDKRIFQARAVDPDQANWIAKKNGTLSAETFTLKYNNMGLFLNGAGHIVDAPLCKVMVIVKDHLIYEVRYIPQQHAEAIAKANLLALSAFIDKYDNTTLVIDNELRIVRNQSTEVKINGTKVGKEHFS